MPAHTALGLLIVILVAAGVAALAVLALLKPRQAPIDEVARVLWAFLVLSIPVLGPVAFYIVDPGSRKTDTPA
jgi:hypothetical protein